MKKLLVSAIILLGFCAVGFSQSAAIDTTANSTFGLSTSGTIKFFNWQKGLGIIIPDNGGREIFVHHSASTDPLNEGDKVSYDIEDTPRGPVAVNVNKQ